MIKSLNGSCIQVESTSSSAEMYKMFLRLFCTIRKLGYFLFVAAALWSAVLLYIAFVRRSDVIELVVVSTFKARSDWRGFGECFSHLRPIRCMCPIFKWLLHPFLVRASKVKI